MQSQTASTDSLNIAATDATSGSCCFPRGGKETRQRTNRKPSLAQEQGAGQEVAHTWQPQQALAVLGKQSAVPGVDVHNSAGHYRVRECRRPRQAGTAALLGEAESNLESRASGEPDHCHRQEERQRLHVCSPKCSSRPGGMKVTGP